jgi:hypothetical protein
MSICTPFSVTWLKVREDCLKQVTHFQVVHGESCISFSMDLFAARDVDAVMHIAIPFKKVLIKREETALAVAEKLTESCSE